NDSRPTRDSGPEAPKHREYRRRVDVDPADDEHVVAASDNANPEGRTPTATVVAFNPGNVAAEKTDHWHRFAGEVRVDELAHGARLEFHRLARVRIDQLHPDVAAAAEVHALLLRALAEQRRRYVANPHNLGDGDAENRLDVIADLRNPAARLAAGDDMGERRGSVVQVGAAWRRDQVGKELRERGRGQKRVGEAGFQAEDDA